MATIILLGPPGAGKGTQTEHITKHYHFTPIVPGNLMRAHIQKGTEIGKEIANYVNEGLLAPAHIALNLVKENIEQAPRGCNFLFDGFPRKIEQAMLLEELLYQYNCKIDAIILLEVGEDIIRERIKKRAVTLGRLDDQGNEKVSRRLEIYKQETSQIITHYQKLNQLHRVQALGTIEEVFERVKKVLNVLNIPKLPPA